MERERFPSEGDEPVSVPDEDPMIDFDTDPIDVRSEADQPNSDLGGDEPGRRIANADLDNTLDEFVDVLNGRNLDSLSDLLAPDAEASFLGESSRAGVVDGLNDLILRYPTLLVTRGDIGLDPIVAVWLFDREADRFDPFGYFTLQTTESGEGLIQRVVYGEELPDNEDVVVETPDRSDLPEWEDWSKLDED
jgi:hypothetical protein